MANPKKNPQVQVIVQELERFNIPYCVEVTGSNHVRVRWRANSGPRNLVVAGSPGEYRGFLNTRAAIRRILRADGFQVQKRVGS